MSSNIQPLQSSTVEIAPGDAAPFNANRRRAIAWFSAMVGMAVASASPVAAAAGDEAGVKAASNAFYAALTKMCNGDASAMAGAWSHGATVTTMHPIGGRETGWDAVKASFEGVAKAAKGGGVKLKDQALQVSGGLAVEIGMEDGSITLGGETVKIAQRVTNVYKREGGAWKLVHHHADLSPAMIEAVKKLGPPK
jgi:ketosteroid isomerase-like protein